VCPAFAAGIGEWVNGRSGRSQFWVTFIGQARYCVDSRLAGHPVLVLVAAAAVSPVVLVGRWRLYVAQCASRLARQLHCHHLFFGPPDSLDTAPVSGRAAGCRRYQLSLSNGLVSPLVDRQLAAAAVRSGHLCHRPYSAALWAESVGMG